MKKNIFIVLLFLSLITTGAFLTVYFDSDSNINQITEIKNHELKSDDKNDIDKNIKNEDYDDEDEKNLEDDLASLLS